MTTPSPKIFATFKDIYKFAFRNKKMEIDLNSADECLIALTLWHNFGYSGKVAFRGNVDDANVVDPKTGNVVFKSKVFVEMHNDLYWRDESVKTGAELCVLLRKYSGKSHKYLMS